MGPEGRELEEHMDQKAFAIQGHNSHALPKDRSIRVVSHLDTKVMDQLVGDEGRTVRKHVVRGTTTRRCKSSRETPRGEKRPNPKGGQYCHPKP